MIPNNITTIHLQKAIEEIDKNGIPKGRESTIYDMVYNGKLYPPKLVISIANRFANGNELNANDFQGGHGTPAHTLLEQAGFEIIAKNDPILELIESYKTIISETKLQDEVYKWKLIDQYRGRPNTEAADFYEEIKDIKFDNLIYAMAGGVIRDLAKDKPEETRELFIHLFDESINLTERVNEFNKNSLKIYRELGQTHGHHQDERTIATYLTFHNPEKYTFYKYTFYKKLCQLLHVKEAGKNQKYTHYLSLIDELIVKYIQLDNELIKFVKEFIPEYYSGTNHKLLVQDILYQMLDKNENKPDLIHEENLFIKAKNKFNPSDFDVFIKYLRKIIRELQLLPNDDRIVFSISDNNLNFTVGQRYGINLFLNNSKGVYAVISKDRLSESSEIYEGTPPQPFYTYYTTFKPQQNEWNSIIEGVKNELNRTTKSGYKKYNNSDFENYVFELSKDIPKTEPMNFPLNTILYGPPGTGKTYHTILKAAEIIENRTIDSYEEALAIFQSNLHDRIEFITFHQNYSYEDFIQGLRPDTENDSQLTFERKDGVFKMIADKALKNLKASKRPPVSKKSFEETFNTFINPLIEGEVEELEVRMKKVSYFITAVTNKSIEFRKASGGTQHTLSISTLRKMFEVESVLEIQGLSSYYAPLLAELLKIGKDAAGTKEIVQQKNYVIIIDEINRANISRVFGELITLIEPDKRSHGKIPLEARLPSGDPFMVPSNLFIIGTMNTADKSIALLDIALRRRFEFEAMYPQYEINGQDIYDVEILKKINEQIIKSKGHDFQIGHAYFMGDNGDLVQRMNKKVIPLLLEYYMNDEKEIKGILASAGLKVEENAWPLRITGKND
ncbi:MAG: AAA family ATPase [Crocinitomicaceae bacterium]|nr:AAA family ATPase [Crocinitomicaceae bacterium]